MRTSKKTNRWQTAIRITTCIGTSLLHCAALSADWPSFQGPGGNPVVDQAIPTSFRTASDSTPAENIAWRVPLSGRSVSGPIVVDGKVITTSSNAMEERWMHVVAIDEVTGKILWDRSTKSTGRPFCHPTSANAAPTPCSDGSRIFAFFSSNDLVCYDLDGNLQWFRSMTQSHPLAGNDVGMGSSPIVVDGVVVVSVECQADSFVAGVDAETGELLWELPRPKKANWASPKAIQDKKGQSAVILHGQDNLIAILPQSGELAWEIDARCSSVATATFADGTLFVPSGGVKMFAIDDVRVKPELTAESDKLNPNSASLLASKLGVMGLKRTILVCVDTEGKVRWNARLEDAGTIWATPVIADQYLYAFGMGGKCYTVKLGEERAEVVAESELGSEVLGSPAINDGAMFVRSVDALWKIAK